MSFEANQSRCPHAALMQGLVADSTDIDEQMISLSQKWREAVARKKEKADVEAAAAARSARTGPAVSLRIEGGARQQPPFPDLGSHYSAAEVISHSRQIDNSDPG